MVLAWGKAKKKVIAVMLQRTYLLNSELPFTLLHTIIIYFYYSNIIAIIF